MGLIVNPYTWVNSPSNQIDADEVNLRFTRLYDLVNGNIDAANIADAGVGSRELAPTTGLVEATSALALTNVLQDIPGASLAITPAVPSYLLVQASVTFSLDNDQAYAQLDVDGAAVTGLAWFMTDAGVQVVTVGQVWRVPLTAAAHTVKLRARREMSGSGSVLYLNGGCRFLYTLVAQ